MFYEEADQDYQKARNLIANMIAVDEQGNQLRQQIVPQMPQEALIENDEELFKETLLLMRARMQSDQQMFNVVNVIHTVLQNIIKSPNEIKYRKLK